MDVEFDLIIAGGGIAGCLAYARLKELHPAWRILLVEKEAHLGGRLRSHKSTDDQSSWGYGLNCIAVELYEFWNQTLKQNPDANDLPSLNKHRQSRLGVLAAGKINSIKIDELFSAHGARAIAGAAAARDWQNVSDLVEAYEQEALKDQAFSHAWTGKRQSPAAIALEHIAHVYGIADLWSASIHNIFERAKEFANSRYHGDWNESIEALVSASAHTDNEQHSIKTSCQIFDLKKEEEHWTVNTSLGSFKASRLLVAQSPWEALSWLPKSYWPAELLSLTMKTKSTSVVVLNEKWLNFAGDLPEVIMLPAEEIQILISPNGEVSYQATLDFEFSLQAPDVVKAVRRLKRARKKLLTAFPNIKTQGDHLALLPVAWTQPTIFHDRRWSERLDKQLFQTSDLCFCGDTYGSHHNGDQNLIESLLQACEILGADTPETQPLSTISPSVSPLEHSAESRVP